MNTTQPVRDIVELKKIKKYYREVKPNKRNFLLIIWQVSGFHGISVVCIL